MAAARRLHVSRYVTMTAPKGYPHTTLILGSAFKKTTSKINHFKRILFKARDVLSFKIFIQIPYLVLIKGFQNPKLCQNKLLFEVKIAFKEKGISKSFYSIQNSWPLQIF
jgi:hypothetical protein